MKIDQAGISLIKGFESFSASPYLDSVSVPTIGYGTTRYEDDRVVTIHDAPVTEHQASELLSDYVAKHIAPTLDKIAGLNQHQYNALCSLCYNEGVGCLNGTGIGNMVRHNPNDEAMRAEFMKWIYANHHPMKGLENRRAKEADLYFTPL